MNLFLRALLSSIEDLAKKKGLRNFHTDYKRDARGELVRLSLPTTTALFRR